MTAFSDYLENKLLDGTLRNIAYTPVATTYVGLHTTATLDANSGTEVTGGSYARTAVLAAGWGVPAGGSTSNLGIITFPTSTASWGTVTHFGIYDGSGGGANLLYWGQLTIAKTVDSGDVFTFPIGNLTVSLD